MQSLISERLKPGILFFIILCFFISGKSQELETFDNSEELTDTLFRPLIISQEKIDSFVGSQKPEKGIIIGGYISSIFHETIDSAKIKWTINGGESSEVQCRNGLFYFTENIDKGVIDITVSHPDYHPIDTTILIGNSQVYILSLALEPRYKILLRGRVYTGNIPLEGVNVEIRHLSESYKMKTIGCYFDSDDYWNCLYNGMFKFSIITDNPDDSIQIILNKEGLKKHVHGMTIHEYQGEIMNLTMHYENKLPKVPFNNLNLKLGFPFMSINSEWFVSLSYYRLINKQSLRRFAYGMEGNMYVSNISVTHNTFPGLDEAQEDSSYIDGFIGPSVLFWLLPPERRYFSTFAGVTLALNLNGMIPSLQPFLGTRFFLDMNKAISLELRYCEFNRDIVHYTFNPYGNADHYIESDKLTKFHVNIGIQIAF
jgi:hypothetical protein